MRCIAAASAMIARTDTKRIDYEWGSVYRAGTIIRVDIKNMEVFGG